MFKGMGGKEVAIFAIVFFIVISFLIGYAQKEPSGGFLEACFEIKPRESCIKEWHDMDVKLGGM